MRVASFVVLTLTLALPLRAALQPSKAELHAWLDEAMKAAENVPAEHRRDLAYSLPDARDRTDRMKTALLQIALRPSGPGWFELIVATKVPPDSNAIPTRREYDERVQGAFEFLDGIYRARAGTNDPVARQWQQGLAEMLFCTGKFDEALALEREVVLREPAARTSPSAPGRSWTAGSSAPALRSSPRRPRRGRRLRRCRTTRSTT